MSGSAAAFAAELAALQRPSAEFYAAVSTAEVEQAIDRERPGLAELAVLLSPAATTRLEPLAARASQLTLRRFGRAVRLFAPIYVSNACLSTCTYCGFSRSLEITRRTLTPAEVAAEGRLLAQRGLRHLLLVSGEHRVDVSPDYLSECLRELHPLVASLSVETQTWPAAVYEQLVAAGCEGVVCYQETYDEVRYGQVHRAGWKRNFHRRLAAVDDAAEAGVRRIGLGALLGLAPDWRGEVLALAAHARYLGRRFWRTEVSVALPRIQPSASGYAPVVEVSDAEFVQALAALRLVLPDAGIVVSTRERAGLRDGLVRIAATTLSAGSSTEPGGYSAPGRATGQFELTDHRSPADVAAAITAAGYDPVFKDAFPLLTGVLPR